MDHSHPIYTEIVECQDCYKCVRGCLSKAIRVQDGHASIIKELCTACGHCVAICPAKAKKIRNDVKRAENLLQRKVRVIASVAPSWVAEFPGIDSSGFISAIKALGFYGVSETALGAQEVSARLVDELNSSEAGLSISSACPAVVEYICKYMPAFKKNVTAITSPLLAHTRILRKEFGNDIGIVFFGPCTAKKLEADRNKDLLDLALTFHELKEWLSDREIEMQGNLKKTSEKFIPFSAQEGSVYPVEGGMNETLNGWLDTNKTETLAVSGLDGLKYYLENFDPKGLDKNIFLEALACKGGCVNGPCRSERGKGLNDRLLVKKRVSYPEKNVKRTPRINTDLPLPYSPPAEAGSSSLGELILALAKIGKTSPADELNCGGCGYDTCRLFAEALINNKAETAMCASFMKKQAQKKANALLRCMPTAAVITDSRLRVIECNRHFAEMFGEETMQIYQVLSTLNGVYIEKILPFANLFKTALRTGDDISRENFKSDGKLLNISIFTIESQQTVGAIIQDATSIEAKREAIASKANEVLRKNLNTVQGIAKLLGEHMADTEIILRSIAKGFPSEEEQPVLLNQPGQKEK
ncbi:MAG: PAS domain-containing protein [Ignavibacteria bacterium]|jgi:iron only hydrogenase large subunit-like protein|nr:PAS domain-containing protein [Ignavibacteria bacterium]MCU7504589.1 PAS domain-containing protein [Ignavibacteria bacterium]MCU7516573.1 PAS domain-containing protein [Ignavibacteria bacterium]